MHSLHGTTDVYLPLVIIRLLADEHLSLGHLADVLLSLVIIRVLADVHLPVVTITTHSRPAVTSDRCVVAMMCDLHQLSLRQLWPLLSVWTHAVVLLSS